VSIRQGGVRTTKTSPQYAVTNSSAAFAPNGQVVVETSQTAPKSAIGKYLLASGCLVTLLFLAVAGNSYRNWRMEQARVQQQVVEQSKDLQRQEEPPEVAALP